MQSAMSSDLSFLPGPMLLAPALALAIAVLWRRDRLFRQPWTGMLHDLTVPVLIGLVGFVYYQSFLLSTKWGWSACRLAPTIGLVHGYPLYSPNSGGVINGWLYGPIAPLIWLPAGWADSPLPALAIASLIDLVFLLAPLVIIARGHSDAHGGIRVSAFIYAAAGLVLVYPTWYMASALCSDTIAVSLGVLSCLALTWNGPPKARNLLLGAALGVCAALTKQTEATLVLAQVGWVSWVHGRKTAAKLIGSYSACAAVAASIVFTAMTPRDVILNMWAIPGSQKLVGAWNGAALELRDFLQYSLLFSVPCLFLWALANRRENVGARPSRNDRGALLFLLVTLVQLPLGIAATIKIGGDRNSMHSVYYLACAFLCFSGTRIRLGPAFGTLVRSISLISTMP